MGSPLGPLIAYAFLCSIEETLEREDKLPEFCKKYVDDIFAIMPNVPTATAFPSALNDCHPSTRSQWRSQKNDKLPFVGIMIEKRGCHLSTSVYRKPADTGLLLHYQNHVDQWYKKCLLKTMLIRAYRLSSSWKLFTNECEKLSGYL